MKLYRDLASVYSSKNRIGFKEAAAAWINHPEKLRYFILNEYDERRAKTGDVELAYPLSFSSKLCGSETKEERKLRLLAKLSKTSPPTQPFLFRASTI
jgi:hypothetical protein